MKVKLVTLCGCERMLDILGPHGFDLPPEILKVPMATMESCDIFGTNLTLEHIGSRAKERVFKLAYYGCFTPIYLEVPGTPLTPPAPSATMGPMKVFEVLTAEDEFLVSAYNLEEVVDAYKDCTIVAIKCLGELRSLRIPPEGGK